MQKSVESSAGGGPPQINHVVTHLRLITARACLPWNNMAPGTCCGDIDLANALSPVLVFKDNQKSFAFIFLGWIWGILCYVKTLPWLWRIYPFVNYLNYSWPLNNTELRAGTSAISLSPKSAHSFLLCSGPFGSSDSTNLW